MASCDNCKRIYENLAAQQTNSFGEWVVGIEDGRAAILLRESSMEEVMGHYRVEHRKFGPFSPRQIFLLEHVREIKKLNFNVGLLCQVLANVSF